MSMTSSLYIEGRFFWFFLCFPAVRQSLFSLCMAANSSKSSSSSSVASLSAITPGEVKSLAFRPYLTLFMNAFRNALFCVVVSNEEVEFSSSTTGTFASLIPPLQEGSKELFGSCRNNIRYAISSPVVFKRRSVEEFLSGEKASAELSSFIKHHREKEKKTISDKSLGEMKPIVKCFCDFLKLSLTNGTTLEQFRLAIETKFRSDVSLWPPGTDSTYSSPMKEDKEEKGVKRKRAPIPTPPRQKKKQSDE